MSAGNRSRVLGIVVVTALMAALWVPMSAGAAPGGNDRAEEARQRHEKAVEYWTADRIANAKPMKLLRVDRKTGKVVAKGKRCNPKKGCGDSDPPAPDPEPDGGGGSTLPETTTSQAWETSGYDSDDKDVRVLTGKVLFTLSSGNYVCSGSIVSDDAIDDDALVLTAGHCAHDGAGGDWATNWTFFPDYGNPESEPSVRDCDSTVLGCWTAARLVTSKSWAEGGDFNYDFAFADLGAGGRSGEEFLEDAINAAGDGAAGAELGFKRDRGEFLTSFGYPAAFPYGGQNLYYCAGESKAWDRFNRRFLNSYDQGLKCDMTGGSSGGPWYAGFNTVTGTGIATSLNSFKYTNDSSTMYGPYFGNYAEKVYTEAMGRTGSGNVQVDPPSALP